MRLLWPSLAAFALVAPACTTVETSGPGGGGATSGSTTSATTATASTSTTTSSTTSTTTTTGTGGASPCAGTLSLCAGDCVDTSLDLAHCGDCATACPAGLACVAGGCALRCVGATTACGGACVELASDAQHCGACGHACGAGEVCAAGACAAACASGSRCGAACVDLAGAAGDCGLCGHACQAGTSCAAGACVAPACAGTLGWPGLPDHAAPDGTMLGFPDAVVPSGNAVHVLRGHGHGVFFEALPVLLGDPARVALADLDGDGHLDLVATHASGGVSVAHNPGTGLFAAPVRYPAGAGRSGLAVGDLDGDGHPDLALADAGAQVIHVLRNHGDGTFQAAVEHASGSYPEVALADLDEDGHPDLIAYGGALASAATTPIVVLRGLGAGAFAAPATLPGAGTTAAASLVIGDLDGDGHLDLVFRVTDPANAYYAGIHAAMGDGLGGFSAPQSLGSTTGTFVALADLRGTGLPDVVVGTFDWDVGTSALYSLARQADGTYAAGSTIHWGSGAPSATFADLDGDGSIDALMTAGSTLVARLNRGDGAFSWLPSPYAPDPNDVRVDLVDMNGDGLPDAIGGPDGVFGGGCGVRLNLGDGTFDLNPVGTCGDYYEERLFAVGDVNGDGRPDLVAPTWAGQLAVNYNPGDGVVSAPAKFPVYGVGNPGVALLGDVDGDGRLDAVVLAYDTGVGVLRNAGNGTFAQVGVAHFPTLNCHLGCALADHDGDGLPDLLLHEGLARNTGGGQFPTLSAYPGGVTALAAAAADLDGDGTPELVLAGVGELRIHRGLGAGAFAAPVSLPAGYTPQTIAFADLDQDGEPDVVLGAQGGVWVYRNRGGGAFDPPRIFWGGHGHLSIADADGDGRPDVQHGPELLHGACLP